MAGWLHVQLCTNALVTKHAYALRSAIQTKAGDCGLYDRIEINAKAKTVYRFDVPVSIKQVCYSVGDKKVPV